ncbi:MAG: DUF3467 domain-containing protein [Phycisphaerae bacterium]|nr:DUF3467 domain-containing protein [Phycisphaerae bacterium]
MATNKDSGASQGQPAEEQPAGGAQGAQAGQQVRLRLDERNLHTSYANAFRSDATPDEVMLYFGLNLINPVAAQQGNPEIIFQANERIIMNYAMAKRLALTLGQVIRRHEEQFGEIELDMSKRRKSAP